MKIKLTTLIVIFLACLALALRLAFFSTSIQHAPVTTDEAIEILMAKHIAAGKPHLLVMSQPYRFPLESYLAAPFTPWLPRTEFGARIIPFLLGLLDIVLFLLILKETLSQTRPSDQNSQNFGRWGAALWILFPSAYLLMQQSAYRITGYTAFTTCSLLAILAALRGQHWKWVFICGLAGGLAFSSTMLALPVTVVTAAYVLLNGPARRFIQRLIACAAGLGLGLLPFFLAKLLIPGAHKAVSGTVKITTVLQRLTGKAFQQVSLSVLGIEPNVFPDDVATSFIPALNPLLFYVWTALCLTLLAIRAVKFFHELLRHKRFSLKPWDLFLMLTFATIVTALTSARFDSRSTRYLLPAVWCFPFIYAGLTEFSLRKKYLRRFLSILLILLVSYNFYASLKLMSIWRQPGFAVKHIAAPDLKPAINFLQERGLKHCYATHWNAYRINFITDEQIVASQTFNERFPIWPIPYKEAVDAATDVAYVLTDRTRFLAPEKFDTHLKLMNVSSKRETSGDYAVYYDFVDKNPPSQWLPRKSLKLTASHAEPDLYKLTDRNEQSRWTTRCNQNSDMWLRIDLPEIREINRLALYYGRFFQDHAGSINISTRTADGWEIIAENISPPFDKFAMQNSHPAYNTSSCQTIHLPAMESDALLIQINEPRPYRNWTITQLAVGVAK